MAVASGFEPELPAWQAGVLTRLHYTTITGLTTRSWTEILGFTAQSPTVRRWQVTGASRGIRILTQRLRTFAPCQLDYGSVIGGPCGIWTHTQSSKDLAPYQIRLTDHYWSRRRVFEPLFLSLQNCYSTTWATSAYILVSICNWLTKVYWHRRKESNPHPLC